MPGAENGKGRERDCPGLCDDCLSGCQPEPGHEAGCGKDVDRNWPQRGEQGYDCQQDEQEQEMEQIKHRRPTPSLEDQEDQGAYDDDQADYRQTGSD